MNFFHSYVDAGAAARCESVLQSGFLSEGAIVAEFEDRLADELGLYPPVAVNSGTAGLHLALAVAGVRPGDEVIVPAQTFVASALAVLMAGAQPVFADIGRSDGLIDPTDIARLIGPKTAAIMPVHWAGHPCDMNRINSIANAAGVAVVEDAAHALGATDDGRPVGRLSRFTVFSFQAIKHLTTGDGGAVCCERPEDRAGARALRWFGIDRESARPSPLGEREFDLARAGFKYHMNNLAAAVGLGNMTTFAARLERHRAIARRFLEEIDFGPDIQPLDRRVGTDSAWWFFPLLVERRDQFVAAMTGRGVSCSVVHRRIDRFSLFEPYRRPLPNQDWFDCRQINLPVHVGLSDDDVAKVIAAVQAGW